MVWINKTDYPSDTEEITSIEHMPEDCVGFIYHIEFTDGTCYIGKKNLYTTTKVKALKSDKERKNVINRVYKNTGKGVRQAYDIVQKQSDWLTYQGSSEHCKDREVKSKNIIAFCFSKRQLTYLEAKMLFVYEAIEDPTYLNENILGSFFRDNLL